MTIVLEETTTLQWGRSGHEETWSVRGEMVFPPDKPAYFGLEWTRLFKRWVDNDGGLRAAKHVDEDEIFAFIIPSSAAVNDICLFILQGFENITFGRKIDFDNPLPLAQTKALQEKAA